MKKIFPIIAIALAAVSCDINENPGFDDADAFVAFPKTSFTVSEEGGSLSIPVHLTSLSGLTSIVSYTINNGTAVEGEDFTVEGGSGVINFAAGVTDQTINLNIVDHDGIFTGDKKFTISLTSADVNLGLSRTVSVTISDEDHPLSALFGTYEGVFEEWWGDLSSAEWTISKDENDITMVWISNFDPYWTGYPDNEVYGYVDADMTTITIPSYQAVNYYPDDYNCQWLGFDEDWNVIPITFEISEDCKTLTCNHDWGTYEDNYDQYWMGYNPGACLRKK